MMRRISQAFVTVDVAQQSLSLFFQGKIARSWPVSTAKNGVGSQEGSFKTPIGLHYIIKKFGEGVRQGAVFKSRQDTGNTWPQDAADRDEDLILSRILWLAGAEAGNSNSFSRYIYIHGTNHEEHIGKPLSQGCVRMRNEDVIAFYDLVLPRTPVLIF